MHDINHTTEKMKRAAKPQAGLANKQNLRLLVALSLLLIALAVVLVKDREFWFGTEEQVQSDAAPVSAPKTNAAAVPAQTVNPPAAHTAHAKRQVAKPAAHPAAERAQQAKAETNPPVVVSNRVALAPLDVEVVAGDTHSTVHPGSNVAKVEIPADSNRASGLTIATLPANAAQRERLTAVSVPELRQTIDSNYPLLGQHSRVQGSVVLQAVIGADGAIENLRVLSGPAILVTAAQQAVRQWRFQPYLLNGQPVETKTRITVNFTIRVADNPTTAS